MSQHWKKLGKIFCAEQQSHWMYTHAMIPVAEYLQDDIYRIFFSPRDKDNRGHGAFLDIDLKNPQEILNLSEKPILFPGALGSFDDSGSLLNTLVNVNGEKLLYYTGINLGVTVKIRNSIGVAKWSGKRQLFEPCFPGPIIDRTRDEPYFVATPEVKYENGIFRAWFAACVRWEKQENGEAKHFYHLKYAESKNGYDWDRKKTVAIDFRDEYEYALASPRIIKDEHCYRMWFCARATQDVSTYRICYAESVDGVSWERKDKEVGIDVSKDGWDSEMICYPYVFDHHGERYMLYNGNGYGRSGFGLAVLEQD